MSHKFEIGQLMYFADRRGRPGIGIVVVHVPIITNQVLAPYYKVWVSLTDSIIDIAEPDVVYLVKKLEKEAGLKTNEKTTNR